MSKGREVAEFDLQCSTATCSPGEAGSKTLTFNFWGPATGGFGTIVGTATFDTGRGGQMEFCGVAFMEDGELFNSSATGTYKSKGKHVWTTQMLLHNSDGGVMLSEGVIDLAKASWKGSVFEWFPEALGRTRTPLDQYRHWLQSGSR